MKNNPTLVIEVFTGKLKQIISTNESEPAIRGKLKTALLHKEIDSFNLYSLENWMKFNKKKS